jgi:hypothetical protein
MPTHSRVPAGSLILLASPTDAKGQSAISRDCFAANAAVAQARLKMGHTTALVTPPSHARAIADYASRLHRQVVVTGTPATMQAYATQLDRSARLIELDALVVLGTDLSKVTEPIVVFGDLHQCWRTYEQLRAQARARYGENVLLVSTGDLFDKGGSGPDDVVATAKVILDDVAAGDLVAVTGNHDRVLATRLSKVLVAAVPGAQPAPSSASANRTVRALMGMEPDQRTRVLSFLHELPLFVRINATTVVVHAAWDPEMATSAPHARRFTEICLYGPRPPAGESRFDDDGKYVWVDWAQSYQGPDTVIHGHHSHPAVRVVNNVIGIDTGCVDGNVLTGYLVGSNPLETTSFIAAPVDPQDSSAARRASVENDYADQLAELSLVAD